ncbi:MAG TPA: NAD(P)/FAD-dependent oxidoreductase [Candidatus Paceibacterota bacterium]
MKRIVVLGAGFGGLRAALLLGKRSRELHRRGYQITIIDKNRYHTYTPLLYEISTTSKAIANYLDLKSVTTYPVEGVLLGSSIEFIQSEVGNIDVANKKIELVNHETIDYEYLILALGAETNFFNIPGLKEHALELKDFMDALKVRDAIWGKIEAAENDDTIDIVIGGAGSTGVELAGEIQEWISQLQKEGYHCGTNVTLIDAAPTVLNGFESKVIKRVSRRLKKLGANILGGERIIKAETGKIFLESGRALTYDVLIWTGGVKANAIVDKLPLKKDKQGRVEALDSMLLGDRIYGIGDIVCVYDRDGKPAPMVARAAISQGTIAVKNIVRETRGEKPNLKYGPRKYPYIIPVGGKYAVSKIGPLVIAGFFGWILKGLVELNYLFSIMPNTKALKIWLKGLKLFIQNDRLG